MSVIKRMVVPPGKNTATQEEYYDTELGRVVPKPENWDQQQAVQSAPLMGATAGSDESETDANGTPAGQNKKRK